MRNPESLEPNNNSYIIENQCIANQKFLFTTNPTRELEYIISMLKQILERIHGITISMIGDLVKFTDPLRYDHNTQFWNIIHVFIKSPEFKYDKINFIKLPDGEFLADWFQKSLDADTRKVYAANYTSISTIELLNSIYPTSPPKNIIDPFCGSGRLITGILDNLENNLPYPKITINEFMPFACILAYYHLLTYFIKAKESINKITIYLGDAFTNLKIPQRETFDLIVMNPPFTRVHRIGSETKKGLEQVKKGYPGLITGQPGLHYYALLLADSILRDGGTVVSILPGSTFVSVYSKPLMRFYLDNYQIKKIIKLKESSAFSDGSSLKEVIVVLSKVKTSSQYVTSFEIMDLKAANKLEMVNQISYRQLRENWNWLKYFENERLLNLEAMLVQSSIVQSGVELELDISRGIEMYGPDFFCIPNSDWEVVSAKEKTVVIQHVDDNKELTIPRTFLLQCLRKSGLYKNRITPPINEYIISIPKNRNMDRNINMYSEMNKHNSQVAQKKFGTHWIHHTSDQISAKQPFGNLFFIDKLSLGTSGIMCHFLDTPYSATKNFYIVKGDTDELKLQAAWINSSCFILLYVVNRREIGSKLGRMQIIDLMNTRIFLNTKFLTAENRASIIEQFDKLRHQDLPGIPDQIRKDYRMALDKTLLLALGFAEATIPAVLDDMYEALLKRFSKN